MKNVAKLLLLIMLISMCLPLTGCALFKKWSRGNTDFKVTIDGKALAENDDYPMRGLNEIMRLHLNRFTYKMDNPEIPVAILDEDDEIAVEKVQKIYYLNIVFQLQHAAQTEYRRFRVVMTRDGILRIEEK